MARTRYRIQARVAATGAPVATPTLTVREVGTTTPITQAMYADTTGVTTKANPFTADSNGVGTFYLDRQQAVDVLVSKDGYTPFTLEEEVGDAVAERRLVFDVRDYGATCDGTTNDTDAVALAVAAAADAGGIVQFPAGTTVALVYALSRTDVWLRGAGAGVTTVKAPAGLDHTNDYTIKVESCSRVHVSDLSVDGDRSNNLEAIGQIGVYAIDSDDVLIERVHVRDVIQLGIALYDCGDPVVRDCVLDDIGVQGESIDYTAGGLFPYPGVTARYGDGTAIWISGATTGAQVLNNTIRNPGGSAVQANGEDTLIQGNYCYRTGRDYDAGAIYCYAKPRIRVLGNTIYGATGAGIDSVPADTLQHYGHVYANNTIIGSLNTGMLVSTPGTVVSGNTILDSGDEDASAPVAQGNTPLPTPANGPSASQFWAGALINTHSVVFAGNVSGDTRAGGDRTQVFGVAFVRIIFGGVTPVPANCVIMGNTFHNNVSAGVGVGTGYTSDQVGLTPTNTHQISGNGGNNGADYERLSLVSTKTGAPPTFRAQAFVASGTAEVQAFGMTAGSVVAGGGLTAGSTGLLVGTTTDHDTIVRSNNATRATFDKAGNIRLGTAALATTATNGYVTIPTCAGTPTGVPANVPAGMAALIFDTTGNKFWVYDGGWIGVALA